MFNLVLQTSYIINIIYHISSSTSSIHHRNKGSMLTFIALYPFGFSPTYVFQLVSKFFALAGENPGFFFFLLFTPVRLQFDFFNYGKVTMHYMLRCSLGRFLSQKMFISKVLFLSEKKIYLSRSSCFYKLMTQILHPQNCGK